MLPVNSLPNLESEYFVNVSNELVYMVPPTSIWTGAEYFEAAATQGMPEMIPFGFCVWYPLPMLSDGEIGPVAISVGDGDGGFDIGGDEFGDVLILIWAGKYRPADRSLGSICFISFSLSMSHFLLKVEKNIFCICHDRSMFILTKNNFNRTVGQSGAGFVFAIGAEKLNALVIEWKLKNSTGAAVLYETLWWRIHSNFIFFRRMGLGLVRNLLQAQKNAIRNRAFAW